MMRSGEIKDFASAVELGRSYRKGINKGLYKIMSKMGISTIASYRGSQLFEIVGLHDEVVELCFQGTVSRIAGRATSCDLESDQRKLARGPGIRASRSEQGGLLKYVHGGEYHTYNPDVIAPLQAAVRSGDYERLPGSSPTW